jgi:DNA-binding PadR family transcriptional regulator
VRLAVLTLLAESPMHGYQIITELTERSEGAWRPSPGSVYPTLQQLEDEGLVTVAELDGRRTYTLTAAGREEVERTAEDRRPPWEQAATDDDTATRLRRRAGELLAALLQVATAGTPEQAERAERILVDARRRLYQLLAEDGEEETTT